MKKILSVFLALGVLLVVTSCSKKDAAASGLKLGMVTDSGTIDDRSFNQGTYEGVTKAGQELKLTTTYLKPAGTTTTDYLTAITDLYDQGYRFVACPGYLFAEAVSQAQSMYDDLYLVIIDDSLSSGIGNKTVAVTFKENESGFLAGVATALKLQTGSVGFVGGMAIPSVQKFNWGYQQGVKYANENLGTNIKMDKSNFVYSGSFGDLAGGQQLAQAMFDKGVNVVFAAAGGTGIGVINEAKARRLAGKDVWAVGVDVDQYSIGDMGNGQSCVLTSAMKNVSGVAYDQAMACAKGTFEGGKELILGAAEGMVGIPESNPNLTPEIEKKVSEVSSLIKSGKIVVSTTGDGLID